MKRMFSSFIAIMLFVFLAGCSSDSTDPSDISNLEGTWHLSSMTFINNANSSQTVDALNIQGTTTDMVMTIESNGNYTITVTITTNLTGTPQTFTSTQTGNFNEEGGGIEDNDPSTTVTLSGNTLTIEDNDETYDFDNDGTDESATLRTVFQRQ